MNTETTLYCIAVTIILLLWWRSYRAVAKKFDAQVSFMRQAMAEKTSRLTQANELIHSYKRVQHTDNAMIERLLKELEQEKETKVELLRIYGVVQGKVGIVRSCFSTMENFRQEDSIFKSIRYSVLAHEYKKTQNAIDDLCNLQKIIDAGIKPKPAAGGDGAGESGTAS
jgi:hypothetical protein